MMNIIFCRFSYELSTAFDSKKDKREIATAESWTHENSVVIAINRYRSTKPFCHQATSHTESYPTKLSTRPKASRLLHTLMMIQLNSKNTSSFQINENFHLQKSR